MREILERSSAAVAGALVLAALSSAACEGQPERMTEADPPAAPRLVDFFALRMADEHSTQQRGIR
jgi:hypothetical protein